MDLDLKRAIALKQFLNEEYFIVGHKAYEGTSKDADDLFYDTEKDLGWTTLKFEDFLGDNFVEVRELLHREERNGYIVLTDEEADEMWEEQLDSYLEECIYPTFPSWARSYFDEEAWKRDARHDGRGHIIASYDGYEHYESILGEEFFIYKVS